MVAPQRILRLTMTETLNTIRYLIDDNEANALLTKGWSPATRSSRAACFRRCRPATIIGDEYNILERIADDVRIYVLANFASLTGCPTATDACATAHLDKLAARAYRRPLTPDEQLRFTALYTKLRSAQTVNGYEVTFTVEEATGYAVNALLMSPQMLWRWEHGDPAMAATTPAGIPLTDHELATHLSFFMTDQPPSDALLAAASAGTLRTNLTAHVETLLASQTAQDWLRTIIETYFLLNQLPNAPVDRAIFPIFTSSLVADMGIEVRKFLDNVLWQGELTDLLLSRTAFLNSTLAVHIYGVPVPAGATETNFVATTLPADRRAGLLTNAAFLTSRGRANGRQLVVPRGKAVAAALLCIPLPPPPDPIAPSVLPKPLDDRPRRSRSRPGRRYRSAMPATLRSIRTAWRSNTTTLWDATGPSTTSVFRSTRTPRSPP